MNRLAMLSHNLTWQISVVLWLATLVLLCWSAGWLYGRLRPRPSLVSRLTEARFVAFLGQGGVKPRFAATTFRYLREVQAVGTDPLPGDHLIWDLGLSEEQVEQSVADLARRLNRSIAPSGTRQPATAEDLAHLLQNLPVAAPLTPAATLRAA